jgi:hypothetical protein
MENNVLSELVSWFDLTELWRDVLSRSMRQAFSYLQPAGAKRL